MVGGRTPSDCRRERDSTGVGGRSSARCCGEASTPVAAVGWARWQADEHEEGRHYVRAGHAGGSCRACCSAGESQWARSWRPNRNRACGQATGAAGLGKTKTERLWTNVWDGRPHGSQHPPAAAFFYSPDRKGEHSQKYIKTFTGVLHADGQGEFNADFETGKVTEAACWAHVRRKFFDEHANKPPATTTLALDRIGALYRIEDSFRGKPPDERRCVRHDDARPCLDALKAWIEAALPRLSAKTEVAKQCAMLWTMVSAQQVSG